MKSILVRTLVLAITVSVAPACKHDKQQEQKEAPAKPVESKLVAAGQSVGAKWTDGNYWPATVTAVAGEDVDVVWDDKTTTRVRSSDVFALPASPDLKVGDRVIAVWKPGARMYTGVVAAISGTTYRVTWDDDGSASDVASGKIAARR